MQKLIADITGSTVFPRLSAALQFLIDVGTWLLSTFLVLYLRASFQGEIDPLGAAQSLLTTLIPIVIVVQSIAGVVVGIYRRRWRYGSFDEVAGLVVTGVITTAALLLVRQVFPGSNPFPRSAIIAGGLFGLWLSASSRYLWRLVRQQLSRPDASKSKRLIVFGAGETGIQFVTAALRNPESEYLPVAFLDDNPATHRLSISGVPVLGGRDKIREAIDKTDASTLLIAMNSVDQNVITQITDAAQSLALTVKVLPPISDYSVSSPATAIRDLSDEDLLGRRPVDIDMAAISRYLVNQRVLVTGAGGSIGSELCRQIARFNPAELIMVDRDESALHEVQLAIYGRALLNTPQTHLADLRDAAAMENLFRTRTPSVVFHAAALKHLPILEQFPHEAFQTNVLGTLRMLELAKQHGVKVFVNISTDKAANPISVLGYSKRIAERLTAAFAQETPAGKFLSVRFGNVLGSRGSVLTSFREQIQQGGPVTVTDRAVTRYFMTIHEAVQLVVQAGAVGQDGEVLVLDMGKPVSIYEMAERMIRTSGRNVSIEVVGLRVGEKMHEELFGDDEPDRRPVHPLISHVVAPPLSRTQINAAATDPRHEMLRLLSL